MALMSAFQPACVLGAAVELDVFSALERESLPAPELSRRLQTDPRATISAA